MCPPFIRKFVYDPLLILVMHSMYLFVFLLQANLFHSSDLELCFEPNLWDFLIIGSHEADVRG